MEKIYKWDEDQIRFVPISNLKRFERVLTILITFALTFTFINYSTAPINRELIVESEVLVLEENKFSQEKLENRLKEMRISFSEIVKAQAILETNNFSSAIFVENNNLFGMKFSRVRQTTSIGENRGHAAYRSWEDSIVDYALWQASYTRQIKTQDQYFEYLERVYAEDPNYVQKLKSLIK